MPKVEITNPDKILFPKDKYTKLDLINYYKKIAPKMLPLVKDRPITMFRFPNGTNKDGFVQKNVSDYFSSWIKTKAIKRQSRESIRMLVCNDKDTLMYLANQACLSPHIWLSKKDKLNVPDRLIFDLDPPKNNMSLVKEGAKALRQLLEKELGFKVYLMTTGSKGVQLVIPLKGESEFATVRSFARKIANLIAEREPKKFTTETRLEKRRGRLFIDYLRNAYAQTGVAPYGVRALNGAPVATPIDWSELFSSGSHPQKFNIKNIFQRRKNPWSGIESHGASISKATKKLEKLLAEEEAS